MNVLYDKNHHKLPPGQLRTVRHLIDQIAEAYLHLLEFVNSLSRCKQLKRAALGRMATIMQRQKDLRLIAYLEQVRQQIFRLPANVGKSSFINSVTRADFNVQHYAFTTKNRFVEQVPEITGYQFAGDF
ncbi:hypothetical protein K435DRAFT_885425 [Dendrothele bispora CBS 962.96]|uniref:NOG1 N-terminal helical domain-containing protein n=1 Tax=Dendrothele bispora (strain CBS 962.96) TaxID=1314807 RepID=A0A4S8M8I8_DENBC|nr:hypothetical protein K435DRAFT_885425 [Dendrothele bispora CBS 962.96]